MVLGTLTLAGIPSMLPLPIIKRDISAALLVAKSLALKIHMLFRFQDILLYLIQDGKL